MLTLSELGQFRQVQNLDRYALWHSNSLQPKILKENKMCECMAYRDVEEPGAARAISEETLGKQHNLLERRHVIAALGSQHLHLCVGWYKPYVGFLSTERPCASERCMQASRAVSSSERACATLATLLVLSCAKSCRAGWWKLQKWGLLPLQKVGVQSFHPLLMACRVWAPLPSSAYPGKSPLSETIYLAFPALCLPLL